MRRLTSMASATATLAFLLMAAGCRDATSPVQRASTDRPDPGSTLPAAEIRDAAHSLEVEHFYFLPPIVADPSTSGTFDASLEPAVDICELDESGAVPVCAAVIASYDTYSGYGSEVVRLETADEHYIVNWHTDEFNLDVAKTYRITVSVAGTTLGWADVDVVSNGSQLKNVDTNEYIALKDGRTLPIKFRIEEGAVFVVGAAGGTITGEDGAVVLDVPAGAVGADIGITIEATTDFPADQSLIPGAVFDLQPDGAAFSPAATLTLSYDEASIPAGVTEASLTMLSEEAGEWSELAGSVVDVVANTVTAPIDGFSKKGVGGKVTTVDVTPATALIEIGGNVQLAATPKNSAGNPVNRNVNWTSQDPAIATVDNMGLVSGIASGTVDIEAKSGGAIGIAAVTVGSPPSFLYVANYGDHTVSVIEMPGGTIVDTVAVGTNPRGVAVRPDGQVVYVTNIGDNTISVIETTNHMVIDTIDIVIKDSGTKAGPKQPLDIVFTSDGSLAYVITDRGFGFSLGRAAVVKIDAVNHVALDAVLTNGAGAQRIRFNPDESLLYFSTTVTGGLWTLDPASFVDFGETFLFGGQKTGIDFLPNGQKGYTIELCCAVVKFDATAGSVIGTVRSGGAKDVRVSADGTRAYATMKAGNLSVIDTSIDPPQGGAIDAEVANVPFSGTPTDVVLSADGAFAYVTVSTGEVAVVDLASTQVDQIIAVGTRPQGMAVVGG